MAAYTQVFRESTNIATGAWSRHHVWLLVIVGLVLHAWLILRWPVIFGGDTILRMANRDHILLSYQLPALQAALHFLAGLSASAALARYFMATVGTVAGVGFYLLATHFMEAKPAFLAALLFVSNPFLLALSTVPYQEILMLAGVFFAFHFFFSGQLAAASLALGLACLTRYEAWAACPVLAFALAAQRRWRPLEIAKAVLWFGWAPLLWMLYRRGLSPAGTFVVESGISPWRFMRYVYLGWITVKNTPLPVVALATIGVTRVWRARARMQGALAPMVYVLLFLISILFSAHGVSPDPERFVTAREAHVLISAVVMLAGFALGQFTRFTLALVVLGFGLGIYDAGRFVERESSPPNVRLSYDLARYLDGAVAGDERVIIFAKPIPRESIQLYLGKVLQKGGAAALTDAQRVLGSMDTSPPDCQRTLVHSRLERRQVLCFGKITLSESDQPEWAHTHAEWAAIWSDCAPEYGSESRLFELAMKGGKPVHTLTSGSLSVSVYRLDPRSGAR